MSWKELRLQDIASLNYGKSLPERERLDGDVPVYGSGGFTGTHNRALVNGPGIILGRKGTIGAVYWENRPFFPIDTVYFVEPTNEEEVSKRFLYYLLRSLPLAGMNSDAAVPGLNRDNAYAVRVLIPNIETQKRIASILSAYDHLIENNRQRIALLEQAARLLYREWFVHFRFPGHETATFVDGLPEGWENTTIQEKFESKSGGTPSRTRQDFFEGSINWIKTQELDEGFIKRAEEQITEEAVKSSAAKIFPKMTLLMSIYGGTNIGRTGILAEPSACNQACVGFFPLESADDWIYLQKWIQENRSYLIGLAQGAAQTNISQKTVRSLSITWPPKARRMEFIALAKPMLLQIEKLSSQVGQLTKARDLLLPRLMDGRIPIEV